MSNTYLLKNNLPCHQLLSTNNRYLLLINILFGHFNDCKIFRILKIKYHIIFFAFYGLLFISLMSHLRIGVYVFLSSFYWFLFIIVAFFCCRFLVYKVIVVFLNIVVLWFVEDPVSKQGRRCLKAEEPPLGHGQCMSPRGNSQTHS